MGYFPSLSRPRTFNEKILWRKVFDHNPLFVTFSDKLACKAWLVSRCPDLPVARLLWSGPRPDDIPADVLRPGTLVKATRGCNLQRFIAADDLADRARLNVQLESLLTWDHGPLHGEWAYSQVTPQLLVEERLGQRTGEPLVDLIVFTCGGQVQLIVATIGEKTPAERVGLFDRDGRRLANASVNRAAPGKRLPEDFVLPCDPRELARLAGLLAGALDLVRVDFMWADGQLHGCEMTTYPGPYKQYVDPALGEALAAAWDLRRSWFLTVPQPGWRGLYAAALRRALGAPGA
jgi:hypothetical protein